GGTFNSLGLNRLAVPARAKHKIMHLKPEDGLLALRLVQGIDQRKRLIRLPTQGANGLAFELINRRLRAGVAGRECSLLTYQRYIQRKMMASKLNHPRLGRGRPAQEGNIILVVPEHRPAAAFAGS